MSRVPRSAAKTAKLLLKLQHADDISDHDEFHSYGADSQSNSNAWDRESTVSDTTSQPKNYHVQEDDHDSVNDDRSSCPNEKEQEHNNDTD